MNFSIMSLIALLALSVSAKQVWYAADRNVTCTGHDEGNITCEEGLIGDAKELDYSTVAAATTPSIKGRSPLDLEKRVTCNLDTVTQGLACFTHCFAIGYCNSHCDASNICHCSCIDKSPFPLVCTKTGCA